jgi:hypothetical protein
MATLGRSPARRALDERWVWKTNPMAIANGSARLFAMLALALLLAIGAGGTAGCGEVTVPPRVVTKAQVTREAGTRPGSVKSRSIVAQIDAASDRVLAEGKVHIASGAPSDAEIRREIRAARKAGIVLPSGDSAASFENAQSSSDVARLHAQVSQAAWNPRSKPIASWIVPILQWAYLHGWSGAVTSGYRTFYEQAQLNAAGAFSAPAGLSNHEKTVYPGGAVDVTSPYRLIDVLRKYPGPVKLVGGVLGPIDPEHFSATGD